MQSVKCKVQSSKGQRNSSIFVDRRAVLWRLCGLVITVVCLTGCSQIQAPKTEPFYAQKVNPPPAQEFRWSNGRLPKSFDPAYAAAAPETDIVRAVYEGLTDVDPKTLQPVPAIAVKWQASEDNKTWTFILREDAKWSNGETITAEDFVRSWKRLVKLGNKVPLRDLLKNIVGMDTKNALPIFSDKEIDALSRSKETKDTPKLINEKGNSNSNTNANANTNVTVNPEENANTNTNAGIAEEAPKMSKSPKPEVKPKQNQEDIFGVEAVDAFTLKISLVQPDAGFPALVAHPLFRPVFADDESLGQSGLDAEVVTSGAFRIVSAGNDGISLERSDTYWNSNKINLEKVRFVPMDSAENALAAYRAGDLDAITNADFEPLALKLLAPYDDFRQTTHSAINFYEFNLNHKPFDDRRVREALATTIDRKRLTDDEMDGVTEPALGFSPLDKDSKLPQDITAAQKLLADAGFANGENFPAIQLLVNRNNIQQRIARAIARMWKKNLNIDTQIIIKDQVDFETAAQNKEFDIVRRGVVLPTTDETANMLALFPVQPDAQLAIVEKKPSVPEISTDMHLPEKPAELDLHSVPDSHQANTVAKAGVPLLIPEVDPILTEQQALDRLPAIPLYFPTAYSLVKPYIQGFDTNILDTPSLKNVAIDSNWQPTTQKVLSNSKN